MCWLGVDLADRVSWSSEQASELFQYLILLPLDCLKLINADKDAKKRAKLTLISSKSAPNIHRNPATPLPSSRVTREWYYHVGTHW